MKIKDSIPAPVLGAASDMLRNWCSDLTPTTLVSAIKNYNPGEPVVVAKTELPDTVTLKQATELLHVSAPTLRRMKRSGEITFIYVSKQKVRIALSDIKRLLEPRDNNTVTTD